MSFIFFPMRTCLTCFLTFDQNSPSCSCFGGSPKIFCGIRSLYTAMSDTGRISGLNLVPGGSERTEMCLRHLGQCAAHWATLTHTQITAPPPLFFSFWVPFFFVAVIIFTHGVFLDEETAAQCLPALGWVHIFVMYVFKGHHRGWMEMIGI